MIPHNIVKRNQLLQRPPEASQICGPMSSDHVFAHLGLREVKTCADIKHEHWFPKAANKYGQDANKCLVCATEMGIDAVSQEAGLVGEDKRREACMIIQEQIESRVKWATNIRKRSTEQARRMERIAASTYQRLGEADREVAGLMKLKPKN